MKHTVNLLVILLITITTLATNVETSVGALAKESTFTGFYLPTGTSELGNLQGTWLADSCTSWSGNDNYLDGFYHIG